MANENERSREGFDSSDRTQSEGLDHGGRLRSERRKTATKALQKRLGNAITLKDIARDTGFAYQSLLQAMSPESYKVFGILDNPETEGWYSRLRLFRPEAMEWFARLKDAYGRDRPIATRHLLQQYSSDMLERGQTLFEGWSLDDPPLLVALLLGAAPKVVSRINTSGSGKRRSEIPSDAHGEGEYEGDLAQSVGGLSLSSQNDLVRRIEKVVREENVTAFRRLERVLEKIEDASSTLKATVDRALAAGVGAVDQVVDSAMAAQITGLSPRRISDYIPRMPGRNDSYRMTDINRYLQTGLPVSPVTGIEAGDRDGFSGPADPPNEDDRRLGKGLGRSSEAVAIDTTDPGEAQH